jgi:hypothetical protein
VKKNYVLNHAAHVEEQYKHIILLLEYRPRNKAFKAMRMRSIDARADVVLYGRESRTK